MQVGRRGNKQKHCSSSIGPGHGLSIKIDGGDAFDDVVLGVDREGERAKKGETGSNRV